MPTSLLLPGVIRIVHWNRFTPRSLLVIYTPPLKSRGPALSTFSNPFFHSRAAVKACFLQCKVRVAWPLHFYEVRITEILYYHQPAGQNSKRAMPPPPTPNHRPSQTLGIVSSSDSRQGQLAPGPLRLNRSSLSGASEPRHQGTPTVSTRMMSTSLPPGTPRRPPSHMEHQTQSRIPRPSAQIMRQGPLAQRRMGFRIGTTMWNTNDATSGPSSTGQNASRIAGLNGLLKPSGRSMSGLGSELK